VTLRDALTHPWLTVRTQIALGVLFVSAALPKIVDPPSFAHMVYNYRLLPGPLVNPTALAMPWAELMMGIALICGIWRRTAASLVGALLLLFIVVISFNLLRGNAIDCGCFDVTAAGLTYEERIRDMWMVIWRDVGMLFLAAQGLLGADRAEAAERAVATE
jgi:uncharacterized membrane protein YphA (DoxX/SURF4 family)